MMTCALLSAFASDGDRVAFYGDSITDNSPYCRQVELFNHTRFPNLNARYYNAGMSGDRVTGGGLGPVDQRLSRDLFSRRPTVVTIMLGMNDASYHPFDQGIFDTYQKGYQHIAARLKAEDPKARVWLVRPSPFDDVTRPIGFPPNGYNGVLLQYSDFVSDLAQKDGYGVVDENAPLTSVIAKINATDPTDALKVLPDRVHPGWQGDYLMSEQILKAWGAPSLVSSVVIDGKTGQEVAANASIRDFHTGAGVAWTEQENCLPFPIPRNDAVLNAILANSDLDQALNQEMLTVRGLEAGSYKFQIDGKVVASLTADQLATGVNLATLDTPMIQQAIQVRDLTEKRNAIWYQRWRQLDYGMQDMPSGKLEAAKRALDGLDDELVAEQHRVAQPKPHKFEIVPG
jgi:lysophospholipase L1-like esterase